jgi:predicted RNA-binding protein with PUA-like domain
VGIARVVRGAFPDPNAKDPRLVVVELAPGRPLEQPVTLAAMRANRALAGFDLLRLPRLSVMPVSAAQWTEILRMAKG